MVYLPRTMNSMSLFFNSPDLEAGATYKVYSGGILTSNTRNWNGCFADGTYVSPLSVMLPVQEAVQVMVDQETVELEMEALALDGGSD